MPLYEEKFISPFAIRFSQARIRPTFQDGRIVEDSMEEIEAVAWPKEPCGQGYDLLLRAPFPPIEIIRWWPKLREEDGSSRTDEQGTNILGDPCWFSFDNRRLYCLQAAAVKHFPARVAAVVHIMHDLPVSKCAPKKFRTTDLGCSVRISRRHDEVPNAIWDWMEAMSALGIESKAAKVALDAVQADANKEHWSELIDVPADLDKLCPYTAPEDWEFTGDYEEDEDPSNGQKDQDEKDDFGLAGANIRTARRVQRAAGMRVRRSTQPEAHAAAVAVAAAASAVARSTAQSSKRSTASASTSSTATGSGQASAFSDTASTSSFDARSLLESSGYSAAALGGLQQDAFMAAWAAANQPDFAAAALYQMNLAAAAAASFGGVQSKLSWQFQQQMHLQQLHQQQQLQQQRKAAASALKVKKAAEAAALQKQQLLAAQRSLKMQKDAATTQTSTPAVGSLLRAAAQGAPLAASRTAVESSGSSTVAALFASLATKNDKVSSEGQSRLSTPLPAGPLTALDTSLPKPTQEDDDEDNCNQQ